MAFTLSAMLAAAYAATLVQLASAAAVDMKCAKLDIRTEWRQLSDQNRADYLAAISCLRQLPSEHTIKSMPGIVTRYDDFAAAHMAMAPKTHYVGQFLPWHRYFLLGFERALRNECDYAGPLPYWDWNLDVPPKGKWTESPAFDPDIGFGGDGVFIDFDPLKVPNQNQKRSMEAARFELAKQLSETSEDRQVQHAAFKQAKKMIKSYHAKKADIDAKSPAALFAKGSGNGPSFDFHPSKAPKAAPAAPAAAAGVAMAGMPGMASGASSASSAAPSLGSYMTPPQSATAAQSAAAANDPEMHPPTRWLEGLAELGLDVSRGMPTTPIDPASVPSTPNTGGSDMSGMDMSDGSGHHHHDDDSSSSDANSLGQFQVEYPPRHFGGGCITNGPFANHNVTLGPGLNFDNNPHCITRDFLSNQVNVLASDPIIKYTLNSPSYYMLGGNIDPLHEVGHSGVGGYTGSMANLWTSLVDPIFWLHHGNLDRVWWSWQMKNPSIAFTDIASPEIDANGPNITLSYMLKVGFTDPPRPISDIMDLRAWPWCKDYDTVYTIVK